MRIGSSVAFLEVNKMVAFRKPYGARDEKLRSRVAVICGEGLAMQSFAKECDINQIMLKWQKQGVVDHVNRMHGEYGDFLNVPDNYQEAMQHIFDAQEMFASLPSSVRKRFANDPGEFLDFVSDPANENEMRDLGLLETKVVEVSSEARSASQERVEERSDRAAAEGASAP